MIKSADLDVVARTLYGEARGEPREGKIAVVWVIKNRVDHPRWWGADWKSVCLKPWQFSCWNSMDPNRPKIDSVTSQDKTFWDCLEVSASVMVGEEEDPTRGANHYFSKTIKPEWANSAIITAEIGNHVFAKA